MPDLLLVVTELFGRRTASFVRIVRPERQVPLVVFGVDTGLTTTVPAQFENLFVFTTVEGDSVSYDPRNLRLAYGRDIPRATAEEEPTPSRTPVIVPLTPEERRLDFNLRQTGATDEQVNIAIQSFRNEESDGEVVVAELRRAGASQREIDNARYWLRNARRFRPYEPPTSGALVEVFPGLATARGSTMVYPAADALDPVSPSARRSARAAQAAANLIIRDIRGLDPNYRAPDADLGTEANRVAYLNRLRQERAATAFRVRGDLQQLQVETFRFLQQRADIAYEVRGSTTPGNCLLLSTTESTPSASTSIEH